MSGLAGKLLVAAPSLDDPNFNKSVVLVCHHDEHGCMGLTLNRPRKLSLQQVLAELGIKTSPDAARCDERLLGPVHDGGPVDPMRGFILHDAWHVYESTMRISEDVHLTASRDVLEAIGAGQGPEHYLMLLGYAGWGKQQLERELLNNDWLIAPFTADILFHVAPAERWDFGIRCMGIDPAHLSEQCGHA